MTDAEQGVRSNDDAVKRHGVSSARPARHRSAVSPGARVLHKTIARVGARVGLAWIGFAVLVAVFAPLLANSTPLWIELADGQRFSPVLPELTAADWALLAAPVLLFVVWIVRRVVGTTNRLSITLWGAGVLGVWLAAEALTSSSGLAIHEGWRERVTMGEVTRVVWAPIPYSARDYLRDYADTALEAPWASAPERRHWFGTDENGADVASRMIHATRVALSIGLIATGIALTIGVILGALMGWFSGVVDLIGMRLVEIFEAIPTLFLLLTFVAFFGRSLYLMMLIIGLTSWSGYARYTRAEFLKLRRTEFVQGAIAAGLPLSSILFRHMLPNAVAPLVVAAAFGVASAILAEAVLSFLGLGLIDDPSWGQMLNQAVQSSTFNWWMAVFPGAAIFLTVFAYNLIGEALRDAVDPHADEGSHGTAGADVLSDSSPEDERAHGVDGRGPRSAQAVRSPS